MNGDELRDAIAGALYVRDRFDSPTVVLADAILALPEMQAMLAEVERLRAEVERLRAEVERLRAEVERVEGQRKLRADLAYLMKAERDDAQWLADQLADALKTVLHDRPSAHTDNVWSVINHALNTYEGVRHEW